MKNLKSQLGSHINEKSEVSYYHSPNFSNNGDRKETFQTNAKLNPRKVSTDKVVGWSECSTVFFYKHGVFCVSLNLR